MFGSESGPGVAKLGTFVGKKEKEISYYAAVGLRENSEQEQTSCKCNLQFIVSLFCNFTSLS